MMKQTIQEDLLEAENGEYMENSRGLNKQMARIERHIHAEGN